MKSRVAESRLEFEGICFEKKMCWILLMLIGRIQWKYKVYILPWGDQEDSKDGTEGDSLI